MASLYQMQPPRYVLARPLAASFAAALSEHAPAIPIDVATATSQHDAYVDVLHRGAQEVIMLERADDLADSCFVEDTVVVVDDQAVITRPGAPSRRGETASMAACLQQLADRGARLSIHNLTAAATLDGGDVLQVAGCVFVGLSRRTNRAAVSELASIFRRPVHCVQVGAGLHLKSVLSALDEQTLVVAQHPVAMQMATQIRDAVGGDLNLIEVPDAPASNVLRLGQLVVVQAGFASSLYILEQAATERGLTTVTLNMSEFIKADGALTCCSVVIP